MQTLRSQTRPPLLEHPRLRRAATRQVDPPRPHGRLESSTPHTNKFAGRSTITTTRTRLIPKDIADQLDTDRWRLRIAKDLGSHAWEAQILEHIDELLDKIGGPP